MTAPVFKGLLKDHPSVPYAPPAPIQAPPIPLAILSPAGDIYTRYVAAALTGLLSQRDSILRDDVEIVKRAYVLADELMHEYTKRTGVYL